ncbi:MAG: hypothetical protein ACOCQM_08035, partial [Natronomonas sp.]
MTRLYGDAKRVAVVVVVATLFCSVFAGVAAADVEVGGEFDGTLAGYGEDAETPNEITVDGQFTVEGETAVNPEIVIEGTDAAILDTDSIEVFVEGSQSTSFDRQYRAGEVRLAPEEGEIPAGTTVRVEFATYFTGGTTADTIDAGAVTVSYETEGGTPDETAFTAQADASNSSDNRIDSLQSQIAEGDQTSLVMQVLAGTGGLAIV